MHYVYEWTSAEEYVCVYVCVCVSVCVSVRVHTDHIHPLVDAVAGDPECEEIRNLIPLRMRRLACECVSDSRVFDCLCVSV